MDPDQARLLRMAAVLLPITCGSVAFSAIDTPLESRVVKEPMLSTRTNFTVGPLNEIDCALRDRRIGYFPGIPAV